MSQLLSQNGDTPIHLVFQGELLVDYSEILHLLIQHGANVNVQNKVYMCHTVCRLALSSLTTSFVCIKNFTFNVILKHVYAFANVSGI